MSTPGNAPEPWMERSRIITSASCIIVFGFATALVYRDFLGLKSGPAAAHWSTAFVGVAMILFGVQFLLQYIARHLDYVSLLVGIVLFVQSATILTSLAVKLAVERSIETIDEWVIPVGVFMILLLLVLVLLQVSTLRWVREKIHYELGRAISEVGSAANLSANDIKVLSAAAKRMAPIEFYRESISSQLAGYADIWQELEELLALKGIVLRDEHWDQIRGLKSEHLRGPERFYWYTSAMVTTLGAVTVLVGAAAL